MNKQKSINDMHAEHNEWLSKLSFYKDELAILQERIEEIASKNTSMNILSMIDHFQNQITIQKKNISDLKHAIKKHETILEESVLDNSEPVSRKKDDHWEHREQMERFEELFSELRRDIMGFLARTI